MAQTLRTPFSVSASSTETSSSPSLDQARWFAEEVQPHEPALRSWLRARFPALSDIDDLVQDTYARLFRARKTRPIEEARPYLFATARNAANTLCRRGKVVSFEALAETNALGVAEEARDPAESVAHKQELAMLAEAISVLPTRCRQILTLRKLHGLSHREIAARLGIAENTVNAQAALGVLRCREYLESRGLGQGGRR